LKERSLSKSNLQMSEKPAHQKGTDLDEVVNRAGGNQTKIAAGSILIVEDSQT
jgi:hypothetical protein